MILYILLFVWGMQSETLTWKHYVAIPLLSAVSTLLSLFVFGAVDSQQVDLMLFAFSWVAEFVIQSVIFAIGFGIGKYRRRGQTAQEDLSDTFS